jgi:hypothetical protein
MKFVCPHGSFTLLSHLDTSLPIQRATMGVKATVGGNRMGDAALWTA